MTSDPQEDFERAMQEGVEPPSLAMVLLALPLAAVMVAAEAVGRLWERVRGTRRPWSFEWEDGPDA